MITPTDCASVITPAVTKPTTSTVVTDEELSTAVTNAPVIAPMKRLTVNFSKTFRSVLPAAFLSPSERRSSPPRKSARPPKSPIPSCSQATSWASAGPCWAKTVEKTMNPIASHK